MGKATFLVSCRRAQGQGGTRVCAEPLNGVLRRCIISLNGVHPAFGEHFLRENHDLAFPLLRLPADMNEIVWCRFERTGGDGSETDRDAASFRGPQDRLEGVARASGLLDVLY
jgi:hypothetical protein